MEINTNNPVKNKVQGPEIAPKISEVKQDRQETPGQHAARTEESPDYRISLSDESKKAVSELTRSQAPGLGTEKAALSEEEATQVAQQASEQLAQTNSTISNQAIQKAVDLFT